MRIAVAYENGEVFQHFGRTERFLICELDGMQITGTRIMDTDGTGHGALAGFLHAAGVKAVICGGIGMGARLALEEAGIRLFPGVSGSAEAAAAAFAAGRLGFDADACCDHHGHDGEGCGHDRCAAHSCMGGSSAGTEERA